MNTYLFEFGDTDSGVVGLNMEVKATHLDAAIAAIQELGHMSFDIVTDCAERVTVHINGNNIDESDVGDITYGKGLPEMIRDGEYNNKRDAGQDR